ncbi:spatzle 5 Toll-1 receptor isoform X1 [Halictus rubicundus]|uniref:spatzle 5 Toll-1 receptor isoform X1 n=1 Tax=Halictus rubicundus TaxID=77578 RepID=UPI0040375985
MRPLLDLLIILSLANAHSQPCIEYGCPGRPQFEPFVPAPPGHTPNCAKPGQTFCESPDHYPRQLIKFLVDKCSFDFASVLRDESKDDYNARWSRKFCSRPVPDYSEGYDYPPRGQPELHSQPLPFLPPRFPPRGQPPLIYGSPLNDTQQNGYRYNVPDHNHRNPFLSTDRSVYPQTQSLSSLGHGQAWWTPRYTRENKTPPRTLYENPLLRYSKLAKERKKRQTNPGAINLCPTEATFHTPKVALNNQGNWMYVVNLSESDQKYTQLVKVEQCTQSMCNGICSLPTGYTSKCRQQFVQKRLVALEGSGNQLYTDVFWFAHGCTCEIMLSL